MRIILFVIAVMLSVLPGNAFSSDDRTATNINVAFSDPQMAIGFLKAVVEHEPNNFGAYNELGLAYAKLRDYEKALECFRKSIAINPANPETQALVGLTYNSLEKPQEAIPYLENAVASGSQDMRTYAGLGAAYFSLVSIENPYRIGRRWFRAIQMMRRHGYS